MVLFQENQAVDFMNRTFLWNYSRGNKSGCAVVELERGRDKESQGKKERWRD